ncbi:hypothetical protein [Sphingomonas sp.]|uniref:hypothetical protein n=1 Tax=Sphingomonas sp. TaxID=28214 RepID=UPI0035C84F4C
MSLPEPLITTIAAAAAVLEDAREPWWIISGAAAAIHGAYPISVADVDVLLSVGDAERLFFRLGIALAPPSDHPRFRSALFGRWTATPLVVEFMARFRLRDCDGIWRAIEPATRRSVRVGSAQVFVPALIELRSMFERFRRAKDMARVDLLDRIDTTT